jgi:hypothetical protein
VSIPAPVGDGSFLRGLVISLIVVLLLPLGPVQRPAVAAEGHLVISEVVTGGASASDELIELYNPTAAALPIEGLELVYVSASGATLTRRVGWEVGAPLLGPGAHLLVANEAGAFAAIADAVYAGGMAATGGSVGLRIQGATTAVDAVGWGDAASAWLEGHPASAPPPGSSIERMPGASAGSTKDTDDNAADFVVRSVPDPQNTGSPPVPGSPMPTPTPLPTATPIPGPTETPAPSASPSPSTTPAPTVAPSPTASPSVAIGTARGLPDGTTVTIDATALTGSAFADGGGYLADATGGIAVLVDSGSFARADRVLVTGTIDDRFAQRTLRASSVAAQPGGEPPTPAPIATGAVNELVEGRLVRVSATIDGGPTALNGGVAFDVDDGSGVARVVVGSATGVDVAGWVDGRRIIVIGVVGQRDSSGTGASGYRVQPRDPGDVELLALPSPTPASSASSQPTPTPSPSESTREITTIAAARAAPTNERLTVRGVVTLASGTIEDESAVVQDATGAILLRLGEESGQLVRGELIEVAGVRSTKSGMESLRVSAPPRRIGTAPDPAPRTLRTGDAGEGAEAEVVLVRGTLVANARRASSGTVSFDIDDGSGPLRVVLGASLQAADEHLADGSWVQVTGVLGQETTGAEPTLGYRVWPRDPAEVRVLAAVTGQSDVSTQAGAVDAGGPFGGSDVRSAPPDSLAAIGVGSLADLRVGATLVTGAWEELDVAGLLWDGERLVGIDASSGDLLERATESRAPPISLELGSLVAADTHARLGVAIVTLGAARGDVVVASRPPDAPLSRMPARGAPSAWVSIVGHLSVADGRSTLAVGGLAVVVEQLCGRAQAPMTGVVSVRGIALPDAAHIIAPCDGIDPAPALALSSGAVATDADGSSRSPVLTASEVSTAAGSGRRWLAVALLAAGVAVLLSVALVRRRLGRQEGGDPRRENLQEMEDVSAGPQLTLVRVPDEHA